jgi:hypothetical protein
MTWHLFASVVPGSPSTGNGLGGWTCAVLGCRTLPVDWRVGVRWRGLDGLGELLAGQRGGRLAASPLDPPPLDGEDLDAAEDRWRRRRWTSQVGALLPPNSLL